jgi:GntR family transcriptional regulator, rspAB operon transcriptional repressor
VTGVIDSLAQLPPLKHQNMTDAVYATLREAILSRRFAPGQRINVDELRQQLGVSRTPLKDGLNRLALQGLVRVAPRFGTFVSELRADEMEEISDLRLLLELHAVDLGMPRISSQQLQQMREHVEAMKATVTPQDNCTDHMAFVGSDHGFHQVILEAAGNHKLEEVYESLNVHIQVARVYYMSTEKRAQQVCDEHEAVLQAYEARNAAGAKEALARHLETARRATIERLT